MRNPINNFFIFQQLEIRVNSFLKVCYILIYLPVVGVSKLENLCDNSILYRTHMYITTMLPSSAFWMTREDQRLKRIREELQGTFCWFNYQKNVNLLGIKQKQYFCVPKIRNIVFLIVTVINITKRFTIHFSRIM